MLRQNGADSSKPRTKFAIITAMARNGIFASQNPRFPSRRTALLALEIQLPGTEFLDAETGGQKPALETADVRRDRKSSDDTAEIPAEAASLESPTKCAVWEDWMVVCAVRYEPVSDCDSLIRGRFTGNFSQNTRFCATAPVSYAVISKACARIP